MVIVMVYTITDFGARISDLLQTEAIDECFSNGGGVVIIPPLFGLLGNSAGFAIMPVFLLIFFILMIIMVELTFRVTKK